MKKRLLIWIVFVIMMIGKPMTAFANENECSTKTEIVQNNEEKGGEGVVEGINQSDTETQEQLPETENQGQMDEQERLNAPKNIRIEQDSYNSLKISWDAVEGAEFYQVYRSRESDGKYALIGTFDANTLSTVSQKLGCGTTYYYKVRAIYLVNGEKKFSDFSSIEKGKTVLHVPQNIMATSNTYNTIKINWDKVEGADYYQVYRSTSENGKYALIGTYDKETLSAVSRKLGCGITYYYKVRAYRWVQGERIFSRFSNIVKATSYLNTPQNIKATSKNYNTIKINWDKVEGADYYQVYRSTSENGKYALIGTYNEETLNTISRKLGCGIEYYYKVRAYRWVQGTRVFSKFSNIVKGIPHLEAPKNVKATPETYNTIKITWDAVEGANYYQVYRADKPDGKYLLLGVYDAETLNATSIKLGCGIEYYYKVRAYRLVQGERKFSEFSTVVNAKTSLSEVPKVQIDNIGINSATINWNQIDGVQFYEVYCSTDQATEYKLIDTCDEMTYSYTSQNLAEDQTHYFKIRGYRWVNKKKVFTPFSSETSVYIEKTAETKLREHTEKVYSEVGRDLRACFNWVVNNMTYERYYGHLTPPSGYTRCQWYSMKAFENHKGNCYSYAGAFYYLAKYLGYDAEYVEGQVTKRGGGYTPHGWVEIDGKYICDPEGQAEISPYLNFYMMPKGNALLNYIR